MIGKPFNGSSSISGAVQADRLRVAQRQAGEVMKTLLIIQAIATICGLVLIGVEIGLMAV